MTMTLVPQSVFWLLIAVFVSLYAGLVSQQQKGPMCGGIPLAEMESFSFETPSGSGHQVHLLKAPDRKEKGLVSQVFPAYLGPTNFSASNCVALKLTAKGAEESEPAENSANTIRAIRAYFAEQPQGKPQHIIDVLHMQEHQIQAEMRKFALSLEEFHRVAIHLDVKRDNFVFAQGVDGAHTLKVIDFDTSRVLPPAGANGSARANLALAPLWPDRWGIFHGPEFKLERSVRVSTKTDIWALGMIAFELVLFQPKYQLAEKPLYARLRQIADIYRGLTWTDDTNQKNKYKLRNTSEWQKVPKGLEWTDRVGAAPLLAQYADAVRTILEVRRDLPHTFLLTMTALHLEPALRLSANGVLAFLAGQCRLPPFGRTQNSSAQSLFPGMSTGRMDQLLSVQGYSDLAQILHEGTAALESAIHGMDKRPDLVICEH